MSTLRIGLVAPVGTPVGPSTGAAGSVEGLVWTMSTELAALGHEVTVFGAAGSQAAGRVVAELPGTYGRDGAPGDWHVCEWMNICRAVAMAAEFDVIHSHGYLWSLPVEQLCASPMLHTLHITADFDQEALRRAYPAARLIAPSHAQWASYPDLPPYAVVPHGVDPNRFTPTLTHAGYLCYLGRFTADKGPLEAIGVARQVGMPLLLAGPRNGYFDDVVRPQVDGDLIRYVGHVEAQARDELLGGAAALIYPVSYAEPFGLVLIEAMMCGTPVVAPPVGAVPEIVDDGATGALAPMELLAPAVERAVRLDRAVIRNQVADRFSARTMAVGYAAVYERAVQQVST